MRRIPRCVRISSTRQRSPPGRHTPSSSHRAGTVIYRNTGVAIVDGQALDYTISLPGGTFVGKEHTPDENIFRNVPDGDRRGIVQQRPVHQVTVTAFTMSICEITQGQYAAITGLKPSNFTGDHNLPVEMVTWFDAVRFCNKLSDAAGLERCYTDEFKGVCDFSKNGFRLPTEAEWELRLPRGDDDGVLFRRQPERPRLQRMVYLQQPASLHTPSGLKQQIHGAFTTCTEM